MAHIIIKNVGPIKEVKLLPKKVNVLMGPQSSGKSTIAKILCHCQWIEKQTFSNIHDLNKILLLEKNFYASLVKYHRLEDYFNSKSKIEYKGEFLTIKYDHSKKVADYTIDGKKGYSYPKITYIPSERNLVTAIPNLNKYNESNDVIMYFLYDWNNARNEIQEQSFSQLLGHTLSFKIQEGIDYVIDDGNKVRLTNASSGLQSLIPLFLVIKQSLSTIYHQDKPLSLEQRNTISRLTAELDEILLVTSRKDVDINKIKEQLKNLGYYCKSKSINGIVKDIVEFQDSLASRYEYDSTQLYIEEPEQNLFPNTQQRFVYELLEMLQKEADSNSSIVLTTHSPYVLFALNNCMMGHLVENNIPTDVFENVAIHKAAWMSPEDVGIYEIEDGKIRCIQDEDGIIEDNYLNKAYKENSAEYLSLLNYYDDEE